MRPDFAPKGGILPQPKLIELSKVQINREQRNKTKSNNPIDVTTSHKYHITRSHKYRIKIKLQAPKLS